MRTRLGTLGIVCLVAAQFAMTPAWSQSGAAQTSESETSEPVTTSPAEISPDWRFSIRPYFFLSGVSGSVTSGPLTFPINSSFGDLFDNVKIGGFVALTAEKGQWGLYGDFQYISLIGKGTSQLNTELELENLIAEADITLRPMRSPTLKFLTGVRVYSIDQTLSIMGQPLPTANTTVIDPIVGAMGIWELGDRWDFELRVDVGGFGVSSEFTYQLMGLFHWDVSETVGIPFGYRVLGYQINTDGVQMDTRMGGLVLGADFRF